MDYIISGIPNSKGGVGRLIGYLETIVMKNKIITPSSKEGESLRKLLKEKKYFLFFKNLILRKYDRIFYILKLKKFKNKELILIHPQTIGLKHTMNLILNNNVTLYVMDNSFFCRRSYNNLPHENKACLKCIGGNNNESYLNNCPHPMINSSKVYDGFYNFLLEKKNEINFYSQNNEQTELLKLHFGNKINVEEIGLVTRDMFKIINKSKIKLKIDKKYDIVYHGANVMAKGVEYIVNLAKNTPDLKYLIPSKKSEVEALMGKKINVENIFFEKMSWESGLNKAVTNSRLIMCPSMWSAPIEGAVVKSLLYNGNLAMVETNYSFVHDIPHKIILKLTGNLKKDKIILIEYLKKENEFKNNGDWIEKKIQNWIKNYNIIFIK